MLLQIINTSLTVGLKSLLPLWLCPDAVHLSVLLKWLSFLGEVGEGEHHTGITWVGRQVPQADVIILTSGTASLGLA